MTFSSGTTVGISGKNDETIQSDSEFWKAADDISAVKSVWYRNPFCNCVSPRAQRHGTLPLGITLKATANELQVSKNQVSEAREDRLFGDWSVA